MIVIIDFNLFHLHASDFDNNEEEVTIVGELDESVKQMSS